jgi:hypothetical protein
MRTTRYGGIGFAMAWIGLTAADQASLTAQVPRRRDIFLYSAKAAACSICHEMARLGTALGPDLRRMAGAATVHSMVANIRIAMTNTCAFGPDCEWLASSGVESKATGHVRVLGPEPGAAPALQADVERDLSSDRDTKWQQPPATVEYIAQEFADRIGFLRWAATGSEKEVKALEIAELQ